MKKKAKKAAERRRSQDLSIADAFADVFGDQTYGDVPTWPPDVFCFVSAVLHQSGAYTRVTSNLALSTDFVSPHLREDGIRKIGEDWKHSSRPPSQVVTWWNTVRTAQHTALKTLIANDTLVAALINLLAAADDSCRGVGMAVTDDDPFLLTNPPALLGNETERRRR